jgi:rhodanese-related sulfurtransferase
MWIGIAFFSGAMLLWPLVTGRSAGPGVSPMQATLMINREDATVIDVREAAEFAAGHIPNSRHIPLAKLDERVGELARLKDKAIIVNCASGSRAGGACATLRKHGFTKVVRLAGGLSAWDQAGLPVTKK